MTRFPPLLTIEKLRVAFTSRAGRADVVRDLDFEIGEGETVGIVGESGSGKSVTALAIMRLLPPGSASISARALRFAGRNLLDLPLHEMDSVRGKEIGMIFQEPMTSLNPVLTIGEHLIETIRRHRPATPAAARRQAIELLHAVRIPDAERRIDDYPHRLSGGQRQRVMIALALSCGPKLLIADEPTTALDVTVQAQVLDLLRNLQEELGVAVLLISHDLRMVADFAHRVIVMYAGEKVEEAEAAALFRNPAHPYTQGLLRATPYGMRDKDGVRQRLKEIPGRVPDPSSLPAGCVFSARCDAVFERCRREKPTLFAAADGALAACFLWDKQ